MHSAPAVCIKEVTQVGDAGRHTGCVHSDALHMFTLALAKYVRAEHSITQALHDTPHLLPTAQLTL